MPDTDIPTESQHGAAGIAKGQCRAAADRDIYRA